MRSDVGDIRYSSLVWLIVLELTFQLIGGHMRRNAHLILRTLVHTNQLNSYSAHEPLNTVFSASHTNFTQVKEDTRAALNAHTLVVEHFDLEPHHLVTLGP